MHAARSKKLSLFSAIIKFRSVNMSIFKKNEAQASHLTLIFWPQCHTLASFFLNQAYILDNQKPIDLIRVIIRRGHWLETHLLDWLLDDSYCYLLHSAKPSLYIDCCDPDLWPLPLTLILKQGNRHAKTWLLAFDLWPTTLKYIACLGKVKVDLHAKF